MLLKPQFGGGQMKVRCALMGANGKIKIVKALQNMQRKILTNLAGSSDPPPG